eukprot:TCALIF_06558-PB protein Name:"Similar to ints6-a Integrator complex subunit 6-A (Xenopus laevis)" AED:0.11 eAED:0.11 QI:0/0.5/0.8/1/1/1/5/294/965
MTIIVFLVDTSASMNQRAFVNGRSTLLDAAKGAVEFFVKMRQKSAESRGDRYMLLTFEESPRNIKAGWKENLQTFMTELKNLQATGMTTLGSALKQVFDTLNINRMQTGIDMYGQGRYPFYLEPAVIVVITDGGKLTTQGAVQSELNLPMHSSVSGSELTREPFRWDQRLYALVLRMAGTPPMSQDAGGHVTGGRSYAVTSQRVLHQCIDSLVQKLQSGVVIHFEKYGPDPPPVVMDKDEEGEANALARADTVPLEDLEILGSAKGGLNFKETGSNSSRPHTPNPILGPSNTTWHSCRRLIYVTRSAQKGFAVGFWPLPEAFWPDVNAPSLPQRSAHPKVNFTCTNQEPMIIDNLPFDKYELEPSPLTLYILARKQPKVCWQVFIQGSSKSADPGHPFGYLKASTNLLTVNLFVLPYNYPVLLPLLDELFKAHRLKPTTSWRNHFENYLRTMPTYFAGPLRRALTRMGAGNLASSLIPEAMDNCLSYAVLNYLKRLKNQAKMEYEKTLNAAPICKQRLGPDGIKVIPRSAFKKELLSTHLFKDKFSGLKDQLTDFPGFVLGIKDSSTKTNRLRNPFDVPRHSLLDQLVRMRSNYLQPTLSSIKLLDDDITHSLAIGQMGNYQDYLKKMPMPLREIESQPVRQHMFGPLPKDYVYRKTPPSTPTREPSPSPPPPSSQTQSYRPPSCPTYSISQEDRDKEESLSGSLPPQVTPLLTPPSSPARLVAEPPTANNIQPIEEEDKDKDSIHLRNGDHLPQSPALVNGVNSDTPPNPDLMGVSIAHSESDSDDEKPLVIDPEPQEEDPPAPPSNLSSPAPVSTTPPIAPTLARADSFRLNAQQEQLMTSEIAGILGTGNGHAAKVNGKMTNGSRKVSRDSSPVTSIKDTENVMSKEEIRSVVQRNQNMRQMIYKEVKRPGKNHETLFSMLKDLHGPRTIKEAYIGEVILEAKRFKRKTLAELLESRMGELT